MSGSTTSATSRSTRRSSARRRSTTSWATPPRPGRCSAGSPTVSFEQLIETMVDADVARHQPSILVTSGTARSRRDVRVLVTGAGGFAGRWLAKELVASGHVPVPAPGSAAMDITDAGAVEAVVSSSRPDAIAHLAAVSYGPDASRDPARAFAINAFGTLNLLRGCSSTARQDARPRDRIVRGLWDATQRGPPAHGRCSDPRIPAVRALEARAGTDRDRGGPCLRHSDCRVARVQSHGPRSTRAVRRPCIRAACAGREGRRRRRPSTSATWMSSATSGTFAMLSAHTGSCSSPLPPSPRTGARIFNVATGRAVGCGSSSRSSAGSRGSRRDPSRRVTRACGTSPTRIVGDATALREATGWRPSRTLDETLGRRARRMCLTPNAATS